MESSCPKCGADREKTKYTPTRLVGGESVFGDAYTCGCRVWRDNKITPAVNCLRRQLAAANAKLAEMARMAEETRLNVDAITGVGGWRPIETAPKGELLIGYVGDAVRLIYWGKTSHVPLYGWNLADQGVEDCELCQPSHWMPLPQPPKEADDDDA